MTPDPSTPAPLLSGGRARRDIPDRKDRAVNAERGFVVGIYASERTEP